jgi:signal transduction histidine kinase
MNWRGLARLGVPRLEMPRLEVPRLGLASFRRRILFRGVFLLLIAATLGLAVALLQAEKERSLRSYQENFRKTQAEILARLRHPAGQLALLNPQLRDAQPGQPLRPVMLPYGALDFDDQAKAQQAVETAGCSVRYPGGGSLCVAIGSNPYSGGFIYLVGGFDAGVLVPRERGALELGGVHRAQVSVAMRGATSTWVAPFEALAGEGERPLRGRLTGFAEAGDELPRGARPVRDFRGWLWQSGPCLDGTDDAQCSRRVFFSIRLPVEAFREALFGKARPVWPPPDLDAIAVHLRMLAPDGAPPLFDSNAAGATPPPSLASLREALLPGETLTLRRLPAPGQRDTAEPPIVLRGSAEPSEPSSPWLLRLIGRLPVDATVAQAAAPLSAREVLTTPLGAYEVRLTGDARGVEQQLGIVATRVSWYVSAMLAALALAWLLIEVGLIRRITVLTRRAAAVSYNVQDARVEQRIGELDVSDLRGRDELGILAGGLSDLLQRVKDGVRREHIRAQQERDMWHAVGHEIMSPLQSLMVLHGDPSDPSHRYVQRMQQAVRVLYGQASPGEALEAAALQVDAVDLGAFLQLVAGNARFAGIDDVRYEPAAGRSGGAPVMVRADEFSLEDVVTHILRNAQRFRRAGTPIVIALDVAGGSAVVTIANQGPAIDAALIDKIFDYGVSGDSAAGGAGQHVEHAAGDRAPNRAADAAADSAPLEVSEGGAGGHRGQGLFVAKTYMAKMGGTIAARNTADGVAFVLTLALAG